MGVRKKTAKKVVSEPGEAQVAPLRDACIQSALDQSPPSIYLTDNKGNDTFANLAMLKMAGSRKK